jgi:hypothetical protein
MTCEREKELVAEITRLRAALDESRQLMSGLLKLVNEALHKWS